jgi:hypothetical protein
MALSWSRITSGVRAANPTRWLRSQPRREAKWWSQSTVWLDGYRACRFDASGRVEAVFPLASPYEISAALPALDALLPKPQTLGVHRLRLLIGAPFVCYYALPWRALPRPVDWLPLARMQFVQGGGGGAEAWRFNVQDHGWGRARLAAAVPELLCEYLARQCKQRRISMHTVEPAYTYAVSRHRRHIADGEIAVVELEEMESKGVYIANIGFRSKGHWSGFVTLPALEPFDLVFRDAASLCDAPLPERIYVIAPDTVDRNAADASRTHWLTVPWSVPV